MIRKGLIFLGLIVLLNCSTTKDRANTLYGEYLKKDSVFVGEKFTLIQMDTISPQKDSVLTINHIIRNYENRFVEFRYNYDVIVDSHK